MLENDHSFCSERQRSRSFSRDAQSVPQNFIPGMFPRHVSCEDTKNNLRFCGLLNTQKITKTKALKSFAVLEQPSSTRSQFDLRYDKTAILDKFLRDKERFGNEKSDGSSTPSSPLCTPLITCDDCTSDDTSGDETKNAKRFTFDEVDRKNNTSVNNDADSLTRVKANTFSASSTDIRDSVASLPSIEDIYTKANDDGGSFMNLPSSRKISRSFTELRDIPGNDSRRSRKISNMFKKQFTYGTLKKTLSQEKLRLQRERDMLDQVQNELRSKLPKTFQVTASLCLNPQLLGRRNTEEFVKPRQRSRGPSMPAIFKWNASDDSGDESSWRNKIREKFKNTKKNNEGVKIKIKGNEKKTTKSSPKVRHSKKSPKSVSVKERTFSKDTLENKQSSPKPLTNFNRKRKPYSESERDSTSSADSGIVIRNIDSPNTEDQMYMKQVTEPKKEPKKKYSSTLVFLSKPVQRQQGLLSSVDDVPTVENKKVTRKISQVNISLKRCNLGTVEEGRPANTDITVSNHVGRSNTIIPEEQWIQHSPTCHIQKYETVNEMEEHFDDETLKEIEEHLKEIDLVFDITESIV